MTLVYPSTWQPIVLPGATVVSFVASGAPGYIVAGERQGVIDLWTSIDGLTWQRIGVPANAFPPGHAMRDLVWTGFEYVALLAHTGPPSTPTGSPVWSSENLTAWSSVELPCQGTALADMVAVGDDEIVIAGRCNGEAGLWVGETASTLARAPTPPYARVYDLIHAAAWWYTNSDLGLHRSRDLAVWSPVALPTTHGDIESPVPLGAAGATLYVAASGYGFTGELWSKTGDEPWQEVAGPFAASENLYHSPIILTGPGGTVATWKIGYWHSAHATQSPVGMERGDVEVLLYRPGEMTIAATILSREGEELYSVPWVENGTGPPNTVAVDPDSRIVRFLHPDDGTVLAELGFDEITTLLHLEWPAPHGWWSAHGTEWTPLGQIPNSYLGAAAVGEGAICVAENIERAELPLWVRRVGFEDTVQQVVEIMVLPLP